MSSVGGGSDEGTFDDGAGNRNDENPLNEWIQRNESDSVRHLREQIAEGRLPLSYGAKDKGTDQFGPMRSDDAVAASSASSQSSSLSRVDGNGTNPYLHVVSRLAPSDLIAKFTKSASPHVQDAVRTTVLGLIGGLPQMGFATKTVATGERLASLMLKLQMTGYMFKNAEYRQSMGARALPSDRSLPGNEDDDSKEYRDGIRVTGKIKVSYSGGSNEDGSSDNTDDGQKKGQQLISAVSSPGMELEVDAQAYMSELRGEVSRLRDELDVTRQAKEEETRKDLLMYIRTLPQQELQQLTGTMSPGVLEAMKGLVTAVLAGIGEDGDGKAGLGPAGEHASEIGATTVTEQSGEALAQLCMWQLVVGFNLRELEVRDEFQSSITNMVGDSGGCNSEGQFG